MHSSDELCQVQSKKVLIIYYYLVGNMFKITNLNNKIKIFTDTETYCHYSCDVSSPLYQFESSLRVSSAFKLILV